MGNLGFRNFGGGEQSLYNPQVYSNVGIDTRDSLKSRLSGQIGSSDGLPECVSWRSSPAQRRVLALIFFLRYGHTFWRFTGLFSSYRYGKHEINCAPVTLLKKVFFQPCFY
ncbi:hypothetical protein ES705_06489 [subsurface metagenome]